MKRTVMVVTLAALVAAGACGSTSKSKTVKKSFSASIDATAVSVAGVCGPKLVLQTDWFPEPEHGGLYQLIGPNGTVDKQHGTYSGPIGRTGVQLEIRAGGPYTGNQQVSSLMYQDPSIFMGFVNTDEAV